MDKTLYNINDINDAATWEYELLMAAVLFNTCFKTYHLISAASAYSSIKNPGAEIMFEAEYCSHSSNREVT